MLNCKLTKRKQIRKLLQARAEERRAMAVATEQEMRAKTQDMQAKVGKHKLKFLKHWQKLSETVISVLWITII